MSWTMLHIVCLCTRDLVQKIIESQRRLLRKITFLYLGSFTETRFNPLELRPPSFNFPDLTIWGSLSERYCVYGHLFNEVYAIKSGDYILRPLVCCRICIFLNTFLQSKSFCRNMKRRAGEAEEGPSNKVTLSDDHQSWCLEPLAHHSPLPRWWGRRGAGRGEPAWSSRSSWGTSCATRQVIASSWCRKGSLICWPNPSVYNVPWGKSYFLLVVKAIGV